MLGLLLDRLSQPNDSLGTRFNFCGSLDIVVAREVANVTFDALGSQVLGLCLDLAALHLQHCLHFALLSRHLAQYLLLLVPEFLLDFLAEPLFAWHFFEG